MPLIEVNGEQMMMCDFCSNIWDGFAQCPCYRWQPIIDSDDAEDEEDDGRVHIEIDDGDDDYDVEAAIVPDIDDDEDDGRVYIKIEDSADEEEDDADTE